MRPRFQTFYAIILFSITSSFASRPLNGSADDPNHLFLQDLARIQGKYWQDEFTTETIQPFSLQFNALYEAESGLIHIANKIDAIKKLLERSTAIEPRLRQSVGLANRYNAQLLKAYLSHLNVNRNNLSRLPEIVPEIFRSDDVGGSNIFALAVKDLQFRDKMKECRNWEINFNTGWSSLLDSIASIHPETKYFASNPQITNPVAGLVRAIPEYDNVDGLGTNLDEPIDLGLIREPREIQIAKADFSWQYFFRVRKTKDVSVQIIIKNVQGLVLARVHHETILGKRYIQSETIKGCATREREAVLNFGPGRMDFLVSIAHFYEPLYGEPWKGSGANLSITATGNPQGYSRQAVTQSNSILKVDPHHAYISTENKRMRADSLNRIYEAEIKKQIAAGKGFSGCTYHSDAVPLYLEVKLKGNSNELEAKMTSPSSVDKLEGKLVGSKLAFPGYDLEYVPLGNRRKFSGLLPNGLGVRFFMGEPDTALIDLLMPFRQGKSLLLVSGSPDMRVNRNPFSRFCYVMTISELNKKTGEFKGFIDWPGGEKNYITGHIFNGRIMFHETSPAYHFSSLLVASEENDFINLSGTRSFMVERPEWRDISVNLFRKTPELAEKLNAENVLEGQMSFGRDVHQVTLSFSYDRSKNELHGTLDVPNLGLTFIVEGAVERNLLVFTNKGFARIPKAIELRRKYSFAPPLLNKQSFVLGYTISPDESREVLLGGWKMEKRIKSKSDLALASDPYSFQVIEREKMVIGGYMELEISNKANPNR